MSIDHDRGAGGPPPEPRVSLERALEQALSLLAQKESELAEVRRSEESYRSLVEKVMDFVFCVDRQGRFTFVNSAVLSLLGYRPEELIGNHFLSVVAEGSRQIAASEFQRNMESSGPRVIYEVEVLSKDGRRIPMEIHGTNVYENGTVAGVRGIARDVSDRRRAEERQKHYISELQTINQIGQQIASVLDLDELLPFIVQAIRKRPEYHYVNVFLRDETGKSVVLKATAGDYGYPLPLGTTLKIGGEGIVGLVAKTGKPVMANDVTKEPRYLATSELQLTKSELAVPVRLGRQVVGVLDIESDLLNAFDEADLRAAMTLADEISVALRNAELFEAERQRREETAIILEVTRAVNSTLLLDEVLRVAARGMARAVGVPNCGMYLLDESGTKLIPKEGTDSPLSELIREAFMSTHLDVASDAFLSEVVSTKGPVICANAETDPRTTKEIVEKFHLKSMLAVPFVARDQLLGVAMITTYEGCYDFKPEQVELAAGIANSVALAIENARLYQRTGELAVMEERNRLAREIHDTIAQGLTGIILQLEAAEHLMDGNLERARMRVEKATSLARVSLQEARRSVWNLRPTPLEDRRLADAIRMEIDRLAEEASWQTSFEVEGDPSGVSGETENGLFRIAQEVLNNVRKHATAGHVDVRLAFEAGRVKMRIRDDGVGFDTATARVADAEGGFGLTSLRERARLLGGSIAIESAPGKGTTTEVETPFAR